MSDKLIGNFMVAESFILNILLFLLIVFNYFKSRDVLLKSSFFTLFIYSLASIVYSFFILPMEMESRIKIHFIFFTFLPAISAFGLYYINKNKATTIMIVTILLLLLEAIIAYSIHIERSVILLNGAAHVPLERATTEVLWLVRSVVSTANNMTLVIALFLPQVYLVSTRDNNKAHRILLDVERYLNQFDATSIRRLKAKAYLDLGEQGLLDLSSGSHNTYHFDVGTHLLNQAIKICCYEPGRKGRLTLFSRFVYWLRS